MEEIPCRNNISSFQPQNQDKPPPKKENVPETPTKPGGNVSSHKKGDRDVTFTAFS